MKKLARIAALLLVGIMTLAMLTGCKGSFETNPKAEELILQYVQDTFAGKLNGKKLTNNSSLHQEAAQILAKAPRTAGSRKVISTAENSPSMTDSQRLKSRSHASFFPRARVKTGCCR